MPTDFRADAPLARRLVADLPEYPADDPRVAAVVTALVSGLTTADPEKSIGVSSLAAALTMSGSAVEQAPPDQIGAALARGVSIVWDCARRAATPADLRDLSALGTLLFNLQVNALDLVRDRHVAFKKSVRGAACTALVLGNPSSRAVLASINLADRYTVVAIQCCDRSTTTPDSPSPRDRMHLVQQRIDELDPERVPDNFDGKQGFLLIPHDDPRALVAKITEDIPDTFCAMSMPVSVPDIPTAAAECGEAARLARLLSRPSGIYTIGDLALEFQLSRDGAAHDYLANLIAPLNDQPHLVEALIVHLRHGGDRKSAAAELFVHPNTLTNRLRKIAELTGITPTTPDGSRRLSAALVVHQLVLAE